MRSCGEVLLDGRPVVAVGRVDRDGPEAQPVRGIDLVPHQAEQRADDERGAMTLVPAHARGDPVDKALAPAGPLHDEGAGAVPHDGLDGLALALAEGGGGAEHGLEMGLERVRGGGGHGGSMRACRGSLRRARPSARPGRASQRTTEGRDALARRPKPLPSVMTIRASRTASDARSLITNRSDVRRRARKARSRGAAYGTLTQAARVVRPGGRPEPDRRLPRRREVPSRRGVPGVAPRAHPPPRPGPRPSRRSLVQTVSGPSGAVAKNRSPIHVMVRRSPGCSNGCCIQARPSGEVRTTSGTAGCGM